MGSPCKSCRHAENCGVNCKMWQVWFCAAWDEARAQAGAEIGKNRVTVYAFYSTETGEPLYIGTLKEAEKALELPHEAARYYAESAPKEWKERKLRVERVGTMKRKIRRKRWRMTSDGKVVAEGTVEEIAEQLKVQVSTVRKYIVGQNNRIFAEEIKNDD